MTEQAKKLATLAQKASLATAEPLRRPRSRRSVKAAEDEPSGSVVANLGGGYTPYFGETSYVPALAIMGRSGLATF